MVNTFLNNYFGFNKQQRNGLLVLMLISLALLVARIAYPYFMKPGDILVQNIPVFADSLLAHEETETQVDLCPFDPNTATETELVQLGLSEKTAGTLIKFRKRFRFHDKKDLLKVYGISPALFEKLSPFIKISGKKQTAPKNENAEYSSKTYPSKKQQQVLELNSADSAALIEVRGIGPAFAKRIIKYRSILGGYTGKQQLKEVYGFTEERYNEVQEFFTVDASQITKLAINTADFKTVNKHPYISYELTKTLFDWRRKTTLNATNLRDIIADEALYQRLLPYLTF